VYRQSCLVQLLIRALCTVCMCTVCMCTVRENDVQPAVVYFSFPFNRHGESVDGDLLEVVLVSF
jgi:hypothetical protein